MNNPSAGSSSKQRTGSSQPSETSFKRKRGVFQKELQHMMYGFGDDANRNQITSKPKELNYDFEIVKLRFLIFIKSWFLYALQPLPESVALMEDIVVEYITELVYKAQEIGSKRGKLSVEDFLYLMRKDPRKLNRSTELLSMNEELKQARRAFEIDEDKLKKAFEEDEKVDQ